ncbi:ABC transporter ATP-binding protein [Candidimonas nitroreducens]|uniref:Polyamine ABC transporter ATP-binding protein n=1 Tax=Candidimonas nitroreducens TaxID=683354 RepID=A0A225MS21_9BURK|nr:ABC transporter ATP-binding protein [Candidimonas nitroreducens]OWT64076.1 polyamine ABC transporter ATP-binding protein [Candidimonas nitroreducens]
MSNIKVLELNKSYGSSKLVLDNINIDISSGEFFTLLGPSGCGKTTLLKVISGFLPHNSGEVFFGTERVDKLPPHRRGIGMVFQDYAIFPHLTVRQNIAFGLKVRKMAAAESARRVADAIRLVRLDGLEDRMPSSLSGGQQQRVGIARALAIQPRLLLMDEPLSNLDAKLRVEMRDDIRKIQRDQGLTTIYVTHDQEEALAISDRICVLSAGKVQQIDRPDRIYRHPANMFVASFLGSMNFLAVRAERGRLVADAGNGTIELNVPVVADVAEGAYTLGFRPEAVDVGGGDPDSLRIEAKLQYITYLGREAILTLAAHGVSISANLRDRDIGHAYKEGDMLPLRIRREQLKLFAPDGVLAHDGL